MIHGSTYIIIALLFIFLIPQVSVSGQTGFFFGTGGEANSITPDERRILLTLWQLDMGKIAALVIKEHANPVRGLNNWNISQRVEFMLVQKSGSIQNG